MAGESDDQRIRVILDALNNTQGQIAAVQQSVDKLNSSNVQLEQTTRRQTQATQEAQSSLVGLSEKVHQTEQAFVRAERNILHTVAIISTLKEIYEVLAEAIRYSNAAMQETSSFKAAEAAAKSLNDTLEQAIKNVGESGEASKTEINALRAAMAGAGTDSEKLRAVTLKLLQLEGTTPIQVSIERLRSQYKVEAALEDQRFASMKAQYGSTQKVIEDHYGKVLDIATREHNAEFAAAAGNFEARVILDDTYTIKKAEIEKQRIEAMKLINEKEKRNQETLERAELETTATDLQIQEDQLKASFARREIDAAKFHDKMNELVNRQTLIEVAALANTVDKDEKANQIKLRQDRKLAQVEDDIITEGIKDDQDAAAAREALLQRREQTTYKTLQNIASIGRTFGREGFEVAKAAAAALAIVETYKSAVSAYSAMAGIPYVGPVLGVAAAAAAIAAGIANVAKIESASYETGGLVEGYPSRKDNRMAMVASGEYIFDTDSVQRMGAGWFSAMHSAIRSGQLGVLPQFQGTIPHVVHGSSFAGGGFVGGMGDLTRVQTHHVSVGFLNSRQAQIDFLRERGTKVVVNEINRRSRQLAS